jgi:abortive infection bacteriophage resistance protein
MSIYTKPHLTFQQQLELLKSRGLEISDDAATISCLSRIGYYRMSAYWYSLRKKSLNQDPITKKITVTREELFYPDTTFEQALALYVFDKRLRLLVLDAIERIEVGFRVEISHLLGRRDTFAHTNQSELHGNFTKKVKRSGKTGHQEWLEKYQQILSRSKEDFFKHYQQKYGLPLPIWVSVELWDFGMLSTFYKGMTVADKTSIAVKFGVPDFQVLESWLRSLNFVRNVVAHHSRLWNKNLIDQPKLPKLGAIKAFDPIAGLPDINTRIYSVLCILLYLMRTCGPNSNWPIRLRDMVDAFPSLTHLSVADMGFPADWRTHELWQ